MKHDLVDIMILKDTATFKYCLVTVSLYISVLRTSYLRDQQWRSLTEKLNPLSAFVYFRWFWSCYFGLGLVSSGVGLGLVILVLVLRIWSCLHH